MALTLIELRVSPYDSAEKIKAEIKRVTKLGSDLGVRNNLDLLKGWLKSK